jgi:hypothetical protein
MLQMRIADGAGTVDVFDGHSWTHQNGVLQFLDTRYAMSGWHGMNEFAVELYDGIGYDGEPITVVKGWVAEEPPRDPDDPQPPGVLLTLTPVGNNAQEPTSDDTKEWRFRAYGNFTKELKASWDYTPTHL